MLAEIRGEGERTLEQGLGGKGIIDRKRVDLGWESG